MPKPKNIDSLVDDLLDQIDDQAQALSHDDARELIGRLRDELNMRADDFDGYFGKARR